MVDICMAETPKLRGDIIGDATPLHAESREWNCDGLRSINPLQSQINGAGGAAHLVFSDSGFPCVLDLESFRSPGLCTPATKICCLVISAFMSTRLGEGTSSGGEID